MQPVVVGAVPTAVVLAVHTLLPSQRRDSVACSAEFGLPLTRQFVVLRWRATDTIHSQGQSHTNSQQYHCAFGPLFAVFISSHSLHLCLVLLRWVWTPSGGWWVKPKRPTTALAVVSTGLAITCTLLYQYGTERENWIHDKDQSVWYSNKDQRKRWIKKEMKAKQLALLDYQKVHGQRPTTAHYD